MQDAWSRAHQDIQVNELTDDQLQAHNHENGDSTDDSEIDDDMLDDRISSSPSIDDGAYPAALTNTWPHRSSSLTPPRQTLNCEAIDSPDSSPFVLAPVHLPLSTMVDSDSAASPASSPQSSSPFLLSPKHLPLSASPLSRRHHHTGEYHSEYTNNHEHHPQLDDFYHDDNTDGWHHLPSVMPLPVHLRKTRTYRTITTVMMTWTFPYTLMTALLIPVGAANAYAKQRTLISTSSTPCTPSWPLLKDKPMPERAIPWSC